MIVFSVLLAALFLLLGVSKLLALPRMRDLAAHAGFSVAAYRGIGALEVAGAAGLLVGLTVPLLGASAGVGLLLLLAGAVITHVRNRDGVRELAPAAVCAVLVAGYLAALGLSS
ncbi:DoxX family protein [Lentzea aerocolonigenes]|uniref:DoxX family protein n=1 Tax=Lentzea aerocolonigenes TaxID=68170 RepID=UPI0004C41C7F|nr:DoxX family protein [Lentzea aerocolonigenes]MCP2248009.1 DoxX-like family protein [Lentzea aerocolonigenes]